MSNLRQRSGQLAKVRKELYDLDITARGFAPQQASKGVAVFPITGITFL